MAYLPYIIHPTRTTENTSTLIDNIYSNNLEDEILSGDILIQFADHLAQFLSINRNIDRITPGDVYRRDFTNFNDLAFKDDISRLDWNLNSSYSINEKFNTFLSKMENCIDLHARIKKLNRKQIRKTSKPWINLYIIKMISHRNKLFKRKKENPLNNKIKITYNLFRNRINREIKKAKKAYYQEYFQTNLSNMKNTWKGIKNILNLNNNKGTHVTQLNYNGKNLNKNKDMVDAFNEFFTNVGPTLDNDISIATNLRDPSIYLSSRVPHSLLLAPTTSHELNEIISNLNDSKSSGPSSISTKLLKLIRNVISPTFSEICNTSFTEGIFPDKNKIAKVIPVHKKAPLMMLITIVLYHFYLLLAK